VVSQIELQFITCRDDDDMEESVAFAPSPCNRLTIGECVGEEGMPDRRSKIRSETKTNLTAMRRVSSGYHTTDAVRII